MKYKILLVAFSAALITGCSTAYQAGQTPDDVYYSPGKDASAEREVRQETRRDTYQDYTSSEDDNYLRMRIRNRSRWSAIDDYDYWYDPSYSMYYRKPYGVYNPFVFDNWYSVYNRPVWDRYTYGGYYGGFDPYRGYSHGIYGYSGGGGGYYPPVYVIKNPARTTTNVSRPALGGYRNGNYSNSNNSGRSSFGNVINRVFSSTTPSSGYSNSNSNSSYSKPTYEAPSRSYNPSSSSSNSNSSSSSSSSSGSSSGGGISRPPRGGGN